MPNYNFYNLSPLEFEELSRDLLQEHLKKTLESFANHHDKGIDFRYAKGRLLIVQCKRYSNPKSLLNNLKTEVKKAARLKPKTYILTTSASLSVDRKAEIVRLFKKHITAKIEVYGKEDLNNLLGLYPKVETRHYKLWLSSVNILEKILHGKIFAQTDFELDEIKKTQQVYVENDSFYKTLNILKKHRFVLITGSPGVGKSTLSRILVLYYIKNGYEEFYSLSKSISEGNEVLKEGVKQVFFFDDFLGRNFLEQKLQTNEESRIVKFIKKVNQSKDKIIIINTRDYILAQAMERYEAFKNMHLSAGKYVVNLQDYTGHVRERILYNHIIFSNASQKHIDNLMQDDNYKKVIEHPNFNPRTIDLIIDKGFLKTLKPGKLTETLLAHMDDPSMIWDHAYKNDISRLSQLSLVGLLTINDTIYLDDLKLLVEEFCKRNIQKYKVSYSDLDFAKSLKELEGTFLKLSIDGKRPMRIDFKDPSVADYLLKYLEQSPGLIEDLITSAVFFKQLNTVFKSSEGTMQLMKARSPILLSGKLWKCWKEKIKKDLSSLDYWLFKYSIDDSGTVKETYTDYSKLVQIIIWGAPSGDEEIKDIVRDEFIKRLVPDDLSDFSSYLLLLKEFKDEYNCDKLDLIRSIFHCVEGLDDILEFQKLRELFMAEFNEFVQTDEFYEIRIESIMLTYAERCYDWNLPTVVGDIEAICMVTGIDGGQALQIAEKRLNRHEAKMRAEERSYGKRIKSSKPKRIEQKEAETDTRIFESLKKAGKQAAPNTKSRKK